MTDKAAEYRQRAQAAREQAQQATLRSQREAHLRSAATWEEKAAQLELIERIKVKNEEAAASRSRTRS